jgi:DNA-binding NtrC family response regulator
MAGFKPLVVVIEDDHSAASALELTLRDWGADVQRFVKRDALRAVDESNADRVIAVIADFDPKAHGASFAKSVRRRAPDARILVLSGIFAPRTAKSAAELGFDFMAKPAAAEAITQWLDSGRVPTRNLA